MKRRDFLKSSFAAGLSIGLGSLSSIEMFGAKKSLLQDKNFDLVSVRGGEADAMFAKGIQSFGGIKTFVKPNQSVVVKPNIGWDAVPERGANTNPKLVKEIVKQSLDAGAKQVYVFDHTAKEWNRCYKNSGIKEAVEDAGGKMVPGNYERYYQEVEVPKGINLKKAEVHELILESDVFINVPIIKHHGGTQVSLAMKNLMGIVWDRGYWHRNNLHQCIADFATYRKPDLNVVDGYFVMKRNSPRGVSTADVVTMKTQIISTDIVAADAAATKILGNEPGKIGHIRIADTMKIGTMNLESLSIDRIKM